MKILKLLSENVKRIKVVEITPTGSVVVIGGKNDSGKTSTLDSIEMALGGAGVMPDRPVRDGSKTARVRLELGESIEVGPDLIVKLFMTASGKRELVVETKDGATVKGPQAVLNQLYNELTFDPLQFEREDDKVQAEILRKLVGLDTSKIDGAIEKAFTERTSVGRDLKILKNDVETLPRHTGVPAKVIPIADITKELADAEQAREQAAAKRRDVVKAENAAEMTRRYLARAQKEKQAAEEQVAELTRAIEKMSVEVEEAGDVIGALEHDAAESEAAIPDTSSIRAKVVEAEAINVKVRDNEKYRESVAYLDKVKRREEDLTESIEALRQQRVEQIAAAKFPVEGLGFSDEGIVTYQGLPFSQASSSTKTLVSMSIAIAKNPKLRVALVRDGSLIGQEKLTEIAAIAERTESQVWIEMMQDAPDERTSVFIEDGTIHEGVSDDAGTIVRSR